jgi:hypothetical protein
MHGNQIVVDIPNQTLFAADKPNERFLRFEG